MSTEPTMPPLPARWYSITRDGAATLCVDEADAVAVAAESDIAWPNNAPHRAVQLVAAAALAQRVEDLQREAMTWRNKHDEIRALLDRRPAINAGLIAAYIKWNGECYALDWINASDDAARKGEQHAG